MTEKESFFESDLCKGRTHCQECRIKKEYREGIAKIFDVPEIDFKCPYGKIAEEFEHIEEPDLFNKGRNFTKAIKDAVTDKIRGGKLMTDQNLVDTRLSICQACNYYKNNKCKKCGCKMTAKVELKSSKCPIKKW